MLGLDKATMSNMVSLMKKQGLIREVPSSRPQNKPGRRPVGLEIREDFGYVIGVELLGDRMKFQISNGRFQKLFSKDVQIDTRARVLEENFCRSIEEIQRHPDLQDIVLLGIGVAVPGIVDSDSGEILHSYALDMVEDPYPFKQIMEKHFPCPVYLDNNANCCARNVMVEHREHQYSHFLLAYFTYDDAEGPYQQSIDHPSLGLGIVLNGDIYSGPEGSAGEFQSINCRVGYQNQFNLPQEDLRVYKKDLKVQETLARDLAAHLALLVNVFNFKQIFLGGDMEYLHPDFTRFLDEAIYTNWPYPGRVEYELNILEQSGDLAGMGGAGLVLQRFFSIPDPNSPQKEAYWELTTMEVAVESKKGS